MRRRCRLFDGGTISAAAGLAIAALFAILPDSARFGGADGIVYAGLLASFGLKAFPIIFIFSCVAAVIAWAIQKARKPASLSATSPSGSAQDNPELSVMHLSSCDSDPNAADTEGSIGNKTDREDAESFVGKIDAKAVKNNGEDSEEPDEEGEDVAMLPMILISLAFSLPAVYLWWLPMLANI